MYGNEKQESDISKKKWDTARQQSIKKQTEKTCELE
jgi:hypothetical protein